MDDRILIETPYGIAELTVSGDELYTSTLDDGILRQLRRSDENDNSSDVFLRYIFGLVFVVVLLTTLSGLLVEIIRRIRKRHRKNRRGGKKIANMSILNFKFIKRKAECVSIIYHNGERIPEWRCPACGMGIAYEYICCPYCCQKVEFDESTIKNGEFTISLNYKNR